LPLLALLKMVFAHSDCTGAEEPHDMGGDPDDEPAATAAYHSLGDQELEYVLYMHLHDQQS